MGFQQQLMSGNHGNMQVSRDDNNRDAETRSEQDDLQCRFCKKRLGSKSTLRIHERQHTGEELYKCKICGKSLATRQALEIHERIHTGERPYVCQFCNKGFSHKGNLKTHYVVHMK